MLSFLLSLTPWEWTCTVFAAGYAVALLHFSLLAIRGRRSRLV